LRHAFFSEASTAFRPKNIHSLPRNRTHQRALRCATQKKDEIVLHLEQKELAERWRMSPRTLEQWRWQGRGPRFDRGRHGALGRRA